MKDVLQWRGIPEVPVVLAAVLAVYASSLNDYFHGDDFVAMVDLVTKSTSQHLRDVFMFQDANFYWRPLGQVYYRAIYEVFGLEPWAFRAGNLAIFLVTVVLLHRFCLNLGLSRAVAFATILLFGLFPNHVVSVAWITNAPRLLATMFFLLSLLSLQRALAWNSPRYEALAFVGFVAACLSDEVYMALAPVPLAYSFFLHPETRRPLRMGVRALALGTFVAALLPLQFTYTMDDEGRLLKYGLSEEVFEQTWALAAQLALPLADSNPMDTPFAWMPAEQWAAGAVTLVTAGVLFVFGTALMRFLVVWLACALAPFMLFDLDVIPPRYVYMAAIPFSIAVAQLMFSAVQRVRQPVIKGASLGTVAMLLVAAVVFGAVKTYERDKDWEHSTAKFEVLVTGLKETYPEIPPGSRVVINYGIWNTFQKWPESAVQTTYADSSISVVSVPPDRVPAVQPEKRPGDMVVFYVEGRFIRAFASR
jgi:hypothetical protein